MAARDYKFSCSSVYIGLCAVVQFSWALTLRIASQHPLMPTMAAASCEEDEIVLDLAVQNQVFEFLSSAVVNAESFTAEVIPTMAT